MAKHVADNLTHRQRRAIKEIRDNEKKKLVFIHMIKEQEWYVLEKRMQ